MKSVLRILFLFALILGMEGCKNPAKPPQKPAVSEQTDTSVVSDDKGIQDDYTNTNRVVWQKPEVVIDLLGDLSEKVVADIGAGTGFFALRLTPLARKVIAIDIEPKFVSYLDSIRKTELPPLYSDRLETRLAMPEDARLKPGEADVILIVNTYMYITDRVQYLKNLKKGLSPLGKVLIVDFKKKRTSLGPPKDIRIPQFQAEDELEQAGFRIVESNDTALDYQYLILAEKLGN